MSRTQCGAKMPGGEERKGGKKEALWAGGYSIWTF